MLPASSTPRFSTAFDRPVEGLEPPAVLVSGTHPAVRLVEGFARGVGLVGRFTASSGMLAIKLASHGEAVRVEVLLRLDQESSRWWTTRAPADEQRTPGEARLVLLHSQGACRGGAVLRRRPGSRGPARASLAFTLTAQELPDDGLLILDLKTLAGSPLEADGRFASHAGLGVAVMRIEVTYAVGAPAAGHSDLVLDGATCLRQGLVSAGDLPDLDLAGAGSLPLGVCVANPSPPGYRAGRDSVALVLTARSGTRAEAILPAPLVRGVDGGPVGRLRAKGQRLSTKLVPLRAAAVRELRRELNMPRLAAAVERSASKRIDEPVGVLADLLTLDALRVETLSLPSGTSVQVPHEVDGDRLVLRLASSDTPLLVRVSVDPETARSVLQKHPLVWTVESMTFQGGTQASPTAPAALPL